MRLRSSQALDDEDLNFMAAVSDALGHPARLQILRYVMRESVVRNDICNKELVGIFPQSQATISQHVKKLVEANLFSVNRENGFSFYSVNRETLEKFTSCLNELYER